MQGVGGARMRAGQQEAMHDSDKLEGDGSVVEKRAPLGRREKGRAQGNRRASTSNRQCRVSERSSVGGPRRVDEALHVLGLGRHQAARGCADEAAHERVVRREDSGEIAHVTDGGELAVARAQGGYARERTDSTTTLLEPESCGSGGSSRWLQVTLVARRVVRCRGYCRRGSGCTAFGGGTLHGKEVPCARRWGSRGYSTSRRHTCAYSGERRHWRHAGLSATITSSCGGACIGAGGRGRVAGERSGHRETRLDSRWWRKESGAATDTASTAEHPPAQGLPHQGI